MKLHDEKMKRYGYQWLSVLFLVCAVFGCTTEGEQSAEQMAEQHQDDAPDPTLVVQEPMLSVNAAPVQYNLDGDPTFVGYMAVPEQPDSVAAAMGMAGDTTLPALIIFHEWWGLNGNITATARRLAGEGYRVLAVDLYGGDTGTTPDEAQALMGQALNDPEALRVNTRSAYEFLKERYNAPRVGVIGWCFGGMMAMRAAVELPTQLDAAVVYYGQIGDFTEDQLDQIDMPILGLFGGQDQSIPVSDVQRFEETLEKQGKDVTIHLYDEAGHAFANPSGRNYVQDAAEDAWDKMTAFLKTHLWRSSDPSL